MPRAKAIADMSDEELRKAINEATRQLALLDAEATLRHAKAEERAAFWRGIIEKTRAENGVDEPEPVFLNPRKTTPIEAPDDGRSSPAQIASNLPGPPAQEASSPGRLESARFDNDDLEIPAFMRRTGGEG